MIGWYWLFERNRKKIIIVKADKSKFLKIISKLTSKYLFSWFLILRPSQIKLNEI